MRRLLRWHDVSSTPRSAELKFTPAQLKRLSQNLVGRIVLQQDPSYASSRGTFANAFQRFPQILVYCQGFADVVACLQFAREAGLNPVCRSGGHSTAAFSVNDDMVIDVSGLNYVKVDRENAVAWVGAGANFAQVDANLDLFDLHVPGGGCDTVGVAGFMQGGGYGMTSQMFGMNCDQVMSFRMTLADGRIVNASECENPEMPRRVFGKVADGRTWPRRFIKSKIGRSSTCFTASIIRLRSVSSAERSLNQWNFWTTRFHLQRRCRIPRPSQTRRFQRRNDFVQLGDRFRTEDVERRVVERGPPVHG